MRQILKSPEGQKNYIYTGQEFLKQWFGSHAHRCRNCKLCPQDKDPLMMLQPLFKSWHPGDQESLQCGSSVRQPSGFQSPESLYERVKWTHSVEMDCFCKTPLSCKTILPSYYHSKNWGTQKWEGILLKLTYSLVTPPLEHRKPIQSPQDIIASLSFEYGSYMQMFTGIFSYNCLDKNILSFSKSFVRCFFLTLWAFVFSLAEQTCLISLKVSVLVNIFSKLSYATWMDRHVQQSTQPLLRVNRNVFWT